MRSAIPYLFSLFVFLFSIGRIQADQIDSILISGNHKTKAQVIIQQLDFEQSAPFDIEEKSKRLRISRENLINLNLFNQVQLHLTEIKKAPGHYVLKIEVVEKWYLWPVPFIEFADRSIYQWSQFQFDPTRTNYGLFLYKYNLFGLNQTLKIGLSLGYTDAISASFRSARLGKRAQFRIGAGAFWNNSEEVWISTESNRLQFYSNYGEDVIRRSGAGLNLEWYVNNRTRMIFGIDHRKWNIRDQDALLGNDDFLGSWNTIEEAKVNEELSRNSVLAAWVTDHRDNAFFALRGYYLGAGVSFIQTAGNSTWWKLGTSWSAKASKYFELPVGFFGYYSIGAYRQYWTGASIPYVFSRALGYNHYVRGYEPFVVDATGYVLMKGGLKWELFKKDVDLSNSALGPYRTCPAALYIGVFFDQAWTNPTGTPSNREALNNDLQGQYLAGGGIGIEGVFYYDKVFRFEYSLSRHNSPVWGLYFKQAIR